VNVQIFIIHDLILENVYAQLRYNLLAKPRRYHKR